MNDTSQNQDWGHDDPMHYHAFTMRKLNKPYVMRDALVMARDALEFQPTVTSVGTSKRTAALAQIDAVLKGERDAD